MDRLAVVAAQRRRSRPCWVQPRRALSGVPDLPAAAVALVVQVVFSIGMWAWSIHFLLNGRIAWPRLWVTAVLTGVAATLVAAGSRVVMPRYTASSAQQFGSLGLVLAVSAGW